jgi:hypothetical protein
MHRAESVSWVKSPAAHRKLFRRRPPAARRANLPAIVARWARRSGAAGYRSFLDIRNAREEHIRMVHCKRPAAQRDARLVIGADLDSIPDSFDVVGFAAAMGWAPDAAAVLLAASQAEDFYPEGV